MSARNTLEAKASRREAKARRKLEFAKAYMPPPGWNRAARRRFALTGELDAGPRAKHSARVYHSDGSGSTIWQTTHRLPWNLRRLRRAANRIARRSRKANR